MRNVAFVLVLCAGIAGCSSNDSAPSTCDVLSPPQIILPTTQDDQRVEAQSSGDPTVSGAQGQQSCP